MGDKDKPMGKIGSRICFITFLIIFGFTIVSLILGRYFWAFLQGGLALASLLLIPLYRLTSGFTNYTQKCEKTA